MYLYEAGRAVTWWGSSTGRPIAAAPGTARMSMSMSPGAVAFVAASQPSCARCIDETLPRTIFLDLCILAGCLFVIFFVILSICQWLRRR